MERTRSTPRQEEEKEDHRRAVVEHGFSGDDGAQVLRGAHLFEQAHHGDGIRGGEDGPDEHAVVPVPFVVEHVHGHQRAQESPQRHACVLYLFARVPWEDGVGVSMDLSENRGKKTKRESDNP